MTLHLVRNLSKGNLIKPQPHNTRLQINTRSQSTNAPQVPTPIRPLQSNAGLGIAVGVSIGLGFAALTQNNILKKYFGPDEPIRNDKPAPPPLDPLITQELLNMSRKVGQMETVISRLSSEMREKDQIINQNLLDRSLVPNNNVFELSKIIEANDIASANRHQRQLKEQYKTINQEYMLKLEGEISKVENKYRPVVNKIRKLEAHLESQEEIRRNEQPARLLWLGCQSLIDRLRFSPTLPLEGSHEYEIIKKFANEDNEFASQILAALPHQAIKEGVCSDESLIDRFRRLEVICKRVAMVSERGGGIGKYLVSYLQSLFIFDNYSLNKDELSGKILVDPTSWHTYEILARVRCCLQDHNIEQAVRYANQLRGQARVAAKDWIRDAKINLETKQALGILLTYSKRQISSSIL